MLRILTRNVTTGSAVARTLSQRGFATHLGIPTDREHQAGRRKEELDAEDRGEVGFNKSPIIPAAHFGTKENPILVPSGEHVRPVGFEDPVTHQLVWFNLTAGKLHFVPDINLYFKLQAV